MIGKEFINLHDEVDLDENSNERITPAGSVWRVKDVNHTQAGGVQVLDLVCDETSAWICPTEDELATYFKEITA